MIGVTAPSFVTPSSVVSATTKDYMFVGGRGQLRLPHGKAGRVSVVATVAYDNGRNVKPYVLRNNTRGTVAEIKVTGTAYVGGKLAATGSDQGVLPYRVPRGGLAMGYVYFGHKLPSNARFEFNVTATPLAQLDFPSRQDMTVVLARITGGRIVGIAKNETRKKVTGPIGVYGTCFDERSRMTDQENGFSDSDNAPPGGRVPLTLDFTTFGTSLAPPCRHWLVASSGYQF
jgi:hypothetical protein